MLLIAAIMRYITYLRCLTVSGVVTLEVELDVTLGV